MYGIWLDRHIWKFKDKYLAEALQDISQKLKCLMALPCDTITITLYIILHNW